jgi:hypothetical protein
MSQTWWLRTGVLLRYGPCSCEGYASRNVVQSRVNSMFWPDLNRHLAQRSHPFKACQVASSVPIFAFAGTSTDITCQACQTSCKSGTQHFYQHSDHFDTRPLAIMGASSIARKCHEAPRAVAVANYYWILDRTTEMTATTSVSLLPSHASCFRPSRLSRKQTSSQTQGPLDLCRLLPLTSGWRGK